MLQVSLFLLKNELFLSDFVQAGRHLQVLACLFFQLGLQVLDDCVLEVTGVLQSLDGFIPLLDLFVVLLYDHLNFRGLRGFQPI